MNSKQETIWALFPELKLVKDQELAQKAVDMWVYFWERSSWEDVTQAPFSYEGTYLKLVQHTQSTVKGAVALAQILKEVQKVEIDDDLLILMSVLHDVSKLVEYCGLDENNCAYKGDEGKLYQHGFLGACRAREVGMPNELVSAILCHTPQTNVKFHRVEALIMQCADHASAHSANGKY